MLSDRGSNFTCLSLLVRHFLWYQGQGNHGQIFRSHFLETKKKKKNIITFKW